MNFFIVSVIWPNVLNAINIATSHWPARGYKYANSTQRVTPVLPAKLRAIPAPTSAATKRASIALGIKLAQWEKLRQKGQQLPMQHNRCSSRPPVTHLHQPQSLQPYSLLFPFLLHSPRTRVNSCFSYEWWTKERGRWQATGRKK